MKNERFGAAKIKWSVITTTKIVAAVKEQHSGATWKKLTIKKQLE
jgi:hypothetical protein